MAQYLAHPAPRPSCLHLPNTNPPTLVFSVIQDGLLFICPSSTDVEPLLALEFLHRVADALEEFLGAPLLASKIESSYDVVAQVLSEMCDGGLVGGTEANALRDVVETSTWMGKLLGGVGLPGYVVYMNPITEQMMANHHSQLLSGHERFLLGALPRQTITSPIALEWRLPDPVAALQRTAY